MPTEEEKKKAQAGQNGQVKPGNADVNDRSGDQQGKAAPPQPAQHRSIDVTVVAGDGMLGGDDLRLRGRGMSPARGRGGYGYGGGNVYGRNSGFAPDDTRNPGYYSSGAIAARREQDRAAREERQARFNAVADRMNAATARRDAKEASDRAAKRASEAAKYTIDAAAWGEMGKRNGQIREERTELTNDDGSLKLDKNGEPQVEVKKFRNEGSMLDAEANKDAIAGMNQWWKEYGQYDQRLGAAKGAFNDKGELDASKLTADQFAELQRVKGNFDAKHKPIQDRIRLHEAENRMRDTDYLQNKGVQVWDTKTGERKLTPEQAQSMARKMRLEEAYGSLRDLADPAHSQEGGKYSNKRGGIEGERDAAVAELLGDDVAAIINGTGADRRLADEASMMRRMRDLGFSADQIADRKGNIDLGRVEAALRGTPEVSKMLADARAAQAGAIDRAVARSKAEIQRGMEANPLKGPTAQQEADAELRAQATAPSAVPGNLVGDLGAEQLKGIRPTVDLTPARVEPEYPETPAFDLGEETVDETPLSQQELFERTFLPNLAAARAGKPNSLFESMFGPQAAPSDDRRPRIGAPTGRSVPIPTRSAVRDITTRGGTGDVDAMMGRMNPLGTAAQIAGAVPAGLVQMAGGATRIATGGDVERGLADVGLGALSVAGGSVAGTRTFKTPRGGGLPTGRFSGGAMPGSKTPRAVQRRMEARVGEGEGVINPRAVSTPLGRKEAARIEANYRRGAQMEKRYAEARAREAEEAVVAKARKKIERNSRAEKRDLEAMNRAVEGFERTRPARVANINKQARGRAVRRQFNKQFQRSWEVVR